jgi:predicted dehydrogenase
MLRVTIVGCGKIADQHVQAIRRIPGCSIVAVCDQEPLMARQLAERFQIPGVFSDAEEMFTAVSPDVVHITTPPQNHFPLAKQSLQAGSHVYLEKPFTVTATEAKELLELADHKHLKVTVGHNYQFTLEMLQMRRLVTSGFLGGNPVHVESHWGYDLGDASYVGPMLGSKTHWIRQLPGQLLQNVISHGVAKLAEFLDDDVEITAHAHQSDRMQNLGGREVQDEVRVFLRDKNGMTGFFCFSTQIGPKLNCLRLCGPKNSLFVDQNSGSVLQLESKTCKSYLTYFVPPLRLAQQHIRNARINIINFLRRKLHQDFGMKELIERFYTSIRLNAPPPIPYREILLTARIMDEIFGQIYPQRGTAAQAVVVQKDVAACV